MPRIAVAAATGTETRCVRPPLPWRPSKLRLDVEALRSPGSSGVRVHAQAHRAAGAAPLGARLLEDHVESLVLGLQPDPHRARYDEQPRVLGDLPAPDDLGGQPEVLDPAVGAGADEDGVDLDVAHRGAGLERHVLQRLLGGDAVAARPRSRRGSGRSAPSGTPWPGLVPQVTNGVMVPASRTISSSYSASASVKQRLPVGDGGVPVLALGRLRAALDVVEGRLVGCDQPGPGAPLDAHVADRHPALHRELLDGRAAVLDDVALSAAGAGVRDQREHEVLGGDAVGEAAVDGDRHRLRPGLGQRLGREHVLDLRRADAERDRAERAVGAGVAVAADDRHPGLGESELRTDDVDDALVEVAERVQPDAELLGVACAASRPGCGRPGRRSACPSRGSARCGPRSPGSGPGGGPCGR